ncbi:MAG: MscS family membrane protein [Planctomycetota bacterium]|jgi:MscS family membrane protein
MSIQEASADPQAFSEWMSERWSSTQPWMFEQVFIIQNWQWVGILAAVGLGVVSERVVRSLINRSAHKLAKNEELTLDPKELRAFERPLGVLVLSYVFAAFLPSLGIDRTRPDVASTLSFAADFVLAVAGVWAAWRFVEVVCNFFRGKAQNTDNKFDDMLVPLMRRTLQIIVVVGGIVFLSSKLTDQLYSILAGLSIGSLAIGFAAKDSIENLFGTFAVLMDKPFQLGDWITVGAVDGTVEAVGFRSTRIRTFYNSVISVPNSKFISAEVDNWGSRRYRRIKSMLTLTYDTPPQKVEAFCQGVRELILAHPYTRKDSFHVYLNKFSGSSLDVLLYCFVEVPDWGTELREKHRMYLDILRLADRLKVGFAFPTQTLHVVKPEDLEHSDTPADFSEGAQRGAELANEIARDSMAPYAPNKPDPVKVGKNESVAPR